MEFFLPHYETMDTPVASGPAFTEDDRINLYYLNELYGNLAEKVSQNMQNTFGLDIPITSGVWGGTYLIADKYGKSQRRIWRLYCLVNLPQNSPLDQHENLEKLIAVYSDGFTQAFRPYDIDLQLKMWGGRLPFSNKQKPSITMHMTDSMERVRWLRAFFIWNPVPWEESVIFDAVRIIKEYKEFFDLKGEPCSKEPKELKYLLQDIIIIYKTLENACSKDFREHADPIIEDLTHQFLEGLHDPDKIRELYLKVFESALIYGYEEALEGPFSKAGLDIQKIDRWPVDKINWVPEELKKKLIPPIKNIFSGFKTHLESAG